jgi:alpha-N-arabinofuranosidase
MHTYVGNPKDDYYDFLANSVELAQRTKIGEGIIREAMSDTDHRKMYIAWDEWNVWYRERGQGKEKGRRILEEHYNLEDALVVATFLNTFLNNAHIVKIANMAQLVNVIAPIFTNENGLYLQTIYYPLQLFANNSSGKSLELLVEGPTYENRRFGAVPYLDISAAYDSGTMVLNVVNRHQTDAQSATFELEDGKKFSSQFEVAEVNGPEIKSQNDFGSNPVKTATKSASASGNTLRYNFPAHSYTMLKGKAS